jgi:succinate dehydrogenase/fumarate reductase-like Fe-S protein
VERLHAAFILAWALVKTLLAPLFGARRGLREFEASYRTKGGLVELAEEDRKELPTFGRCIACGRCNVGDASRIVASKGAFGGVMDLILASSRSMPDFAVAARSFEAIDDARLANLERTCPTAVPMRAIRAFVLRHRNSP